MPKNKDKQRKIPIDHIQTINQIDKIANYPISAEERIILIKGEINEWRK